MEAAHSSVDEWINNYEIYTMEYYLALKRKKISPFATAWIDLENIMLSYEISQSENNKYHMISLSVESNEQSELIRKMGTDSQMESRMKARGAGERVEGLSKKGKGLMDMDNAMVIAGGIRELNGYRKNTKKDRIKQEGNVLLWSRDKIPHNQ